MQSILIFICKRDPEKNRKTDTMKTTWKEGIIFIKITNMKINKIKLKELRGL